MFPDGKPVATFPGNTLDEQDDTDLQRKGELMKIVNFLLALFAIVLAIAAIGISFRGGSGWSRYAYGNSHSWAVTEDSDSVIWNTGDRPASVTVCNGRYRRRAEPHDVIVRVGAGETAEDHVLVHRSCMTVRSTRIEIMKPEGESFTARGRYQTDRGFRRWRGSRRYWRGRTDQTEQGATQQEGTQDQAAAGALSGSSCS